MNGFLKGLLTCLALIYCVSPVDACQGPIDDLLVIFLTIAMNKIGGSNSGRDYLEYC